jgi:hypothetical protein
MYNGVKETTMQNDEYVKFLSFLLTMGMSFAFLKSFIKSVNSPINLNMDFVELFRIKEETIFPPPVPNTASVVANVTVSEKVKKQEPKKPTVKRDADGYTDLQRDCFAALKSLGIKTQKERKFLVNSIFNKHNPATVQDFIKLAFA